MVTYRLLWCWWPSNTQKIVNIVIDTTSRSNSSSRIVVKPWPSAVRHAYPWKLTIRSISVQILLSKLIILIVHSCDCQLNCSRPVNYAPFNRTLGLSCHRHDGLSPSEILSTTRSQCWFSQIILIMCSKHLVRCIWYGHARSRWHDKYVPITEAFDSEGQHFESSRWMMLCPCLVCYRHLSCLRSC
jgi:hypothetical protein